MKFCKYVRYIHVWKSITFRSDPIQNGRLINDLLNVTIFLNAEKTKTRVSPYFVIVSIAALKKKDMKCLTKCHVSNIAHQNKI